MSVQSTVITPVASDTKWLYQVGGISALIIGIAYIITIALYVPMGAPPNGAEARLIYHAGNTTLWWAIFGLMILTDLLFVPVALSLYFALKANNRSLMLIATACVALFIVLDMAVLWPNKASLITLSGNYATATNDAQRLTLVTAATYPSALLESSVLIGVYSILTLSVGILLIGFVMLKAGNFSKITAYLGLATGISGIVAVAAPFVSALSVAVIINAVLATVWALFAGYRLYRLGQL